MATIYTYPQKTTLSSDDLILLSDSASTPTTNITKSATLGSLASFIGEVGGVSGSGTLNTIPLWTPDGNTLGDSIMTQQTAAGEFNSDYIQIGGTGGIATENLKVDGWILDSFGSKGTDGQVLASTGAATEWVDRSTYTTIIGNGDASEFTNQLLLETDPPLRIKFGPGIVTTDVTIASDGLITFNTAGTYFLNLTASLGKPNNQGDAVLNSRFYNVTDAEQFGPTQEFAAKFADENPIERSIIVPVDTDGWQLEYQLGVNSNSNYNNGAGLLSANGEPTGWTQTASASIVILKLTT